MGVKVFVGVERSAPHLELVPTTGHPRTKRWLFVVWFGAVLTPFLLQLRIYVQLVTPHKIPQDLLSFDEERHDDQLRQRCPVHEMFIAGVWWNIWPTHFSAPATGEICHFVVPQYNIHGEYRLANSSTASAHDTDCPSKAIPIDYYFYHGSFGYYSFYEEGAGSFCRDHSTARVKVVKLGSFDMNGQKLADDGGSAEYRQSYWFGSVSLIWFGFRALVVRRSFVLFKRHVDRCQQLNVALRLRDALIYIQETARLSAHSARGPHRILLLLFLLEGLMGDLFLIITREGFSALVQFISLGYNLSAVISTMFELIESCQCLGKRTRVVKRLLFNHETTMIGEVLAVGMTQAFLTTLNRSQLQDSMPVSKAISYYAWGLFGHAFCAFGPTSVVFIIRALGAVAVAWRKYHSLAPLTADCCVDNVLGARQKLAAVTGYCRDNGKLFYSEDLLLAFGLFRTTDVSTGNMVLVHEEVQWFATPRNGMVAIGIIRGSHVDPIAEQRVRDGATMKMIDELFLVQAQELMATAVEMNSNADETMTP